VSTVRYLHRARCDELGGLASGKFGRAGCPVENLGLQPEMRDGEVANRRHLL